MTEKNIKEQKQQEEEIIVSELEKCNKEKDDLIALSQRLKADFINNKKENEKMIAQFAQFANKDLFLKILPIVDSFTRALTHIPKSIEKDQWVVGMEKIKNQINGILKEAGVTEMTTMDTQFSPQLHEAIAQTEAEDDGRIVEEFEKGYMFHDEILRVAKVRITVKTEKK